MSWHSSKPKFSHIVSLQPQKSLRKRLLLSFPFISSYMVSIREFPTTLRTRWTQRRPDGSWCDSKPKQHFLNFYFIIIKPQNKQMQMLHQAEGAFTLLAAMTQGLNEHSSPCWSAMSSRHSAPRAPTARNALGKTAKSLEQPSMNFPVEEFKSLHSVLME